MLPAADDDADLHAQVVDLLDLLAGALQGFGVDRIARLLPAKELAGELEDDAFVFHPGVHG